MKTKGELMYSRFHHFYDQPLKIIEREKEERFIVETFQDETPESKVYIITGRADRENRFF